MEAQRSLILCLIPASCRAFAFQETTYILVRGAVSENNKGPEYYGREACIRGMRITVGMILGQIAAGTTESELLAEYPYLEQADIREAIRYGAWLAQEREIDVQPA